MNCPVGLISCRSNVLSAKCLSVKGPVGQTSVGLVSVGQTSAARHANILFTRNHSSLGTAGSEDVALPESLRWRNKENAAAVKAMGYFELLKHYRWSVGFKEKSLRRQRPFDGKDPSIATCKGTSMAMQGHFEGKKNSLRWQRKEHFEAKSPWLAKTFRRQKQFEGKM